jgi:hypothetical protein
MKETRSHQQLDALRQAFEILTNVAELREEVKKLTTKLNPVSRARINRRLTAAEDKLQEALTLVLQALAPANGLASTTLFDAVEQLRTNRRVQDVDSDVLQDAIRDARVLFDEAVVIVGKSSPANVTRRLVDWLQDTVIERTTQWAEAQQAEAEAGRPLIRRVLFGVAAVVTTLTALDFFFLDLGIIAGISGSVDFFVRKVIFQQVPVPQDFHSLPFFTIGQF